MERASEGALEEAIKLWRDLEGYCELRRVENRRSHTQQGLAMKEQENMFSSVSWQRGWNCGGL